MDQLYVALLKVVLAQHRKKFKGIFPVQGCFETKESSFLILEGGRGGGRTFICDSSKTLF